jgi:cobalt-precorrin-5B (C1)-methyltransferase
MLDPVSGFPYPAKWVSLCTDEASRLLVTQGLAILTSDGTIRRRGFTTGSTAAAAAKAAVLSLMKTGMREVSILTPARITIKIPVCAENGTGECIKYAGDYPGDVTAGLAFTAEAVIAESGISVTLGKVSADGAGTHHDAKPEIRPSHSTQKMRSYMQLRRQLAKPAFRE